jgi:hypothetical protein
MKGNMDDGAERERARCVGICRGRAELWRKRAAGNPVPGVLQEAQARANEADYLADLLESGIDLASFNPGGSHKAEA